jgi:hypothetical protein
MKNDTTRLALAAAVALGSLAVAGAGGCRQTKCEELRDELRTRWTDARDPMTGERTNPSFDTDLLSPPDDPDPARCLRLEPEFHRFPGADDISFTCDPTMECPAGVTCQMDGTSVTGFSCGGAGGAPCDPMQCSPTETCRIAPGADLDEASARCRPQCDPVCPYGGSCTVASATSSTGFRCSSPMGSGAVCDPAVTTDECAEPGTVCVASNANDLTVGGWCDNPNGPVCMKILQGLFFDDFCPQCEEYEMRICTCSTGPAHFQCMARWAEVRGLHVPPDTRFERRSCRLAMTDFDCRAFARPTADFFQNPPWSLCGQDSECVGDRCLLLNPDAVDPANSAVCSNSCDNHDDCPLGLSFQFVCAENPVDRDGNRVAPACVPVDSTLTGHDLGSACNPNAPTGCEPFTCYRRPDDLTTGNPVGVCSVRCDVPGDEVCIPNGMFCSTMPVFPDRGAFCDVLVPFGSECGQYLADRDAACGDLPGDTDDFGRRCVDRTPDPETGSARTMCSLDCDPAGTGIGCPVGAFCRTDDLSGALPQPWCDLFVDRFARCDATDPAPRNGCEDPNVCAERPTAAGEFICTPCCDPAGGITCPGGSTCRTAAGAVPACGALTGVCDPN